MSRYIDADKMKEMIEAKADTLIEGKEAFLYVAKWLDFLPSADVVEVRHGEWIYHECVSSYDGLKSGYACSVCNSFVEDEYFEAEEFHKKFCGNCGAKMDGERREE